MKKRLSILLILSLLAAATLEPTAMPVPTTPSSTLVPIEPPSVFPLSPTSQPSPDVVSTLSIVSFSALPNPVERGGDLRIAWQADGASHVALWSMTYDSKPGRWYRQGDPISTGSATGGHRLSVPSDANHRLRFELEATDAAGNSVAAASDEIRLVCHPIFFDLPWTAWCPSLPQTTLAAFQAFEGGYMIWRADTGQVYTLLQPVGPELPPAWFAVLPASEVVQADAPPGRYPPGEHFQWVWSSLTEYWHSLGWGVSPEQTFALTEQLSLSPGDTISQNDDLYLSWPDDGSLACLCTWVLLITPAAPPGPSSAPPPRRSRSRQRLCNDSVSHRRAALSLSIRK